VLAAFGGVLPCFEEAHPRFEARREPKAEIDRGTLEQVLQRVGGNRSAAARELGLSRRALYRRLDSFGLR
jgi:DNA-binding NtrC family response regulator